MQETISLLIKRETAIRFRDLGAVNADAFTPFVKGMNTAGTVAITLEPAVWNRLQKGQHSQSDVQVIKEQLELALGGE